MTTTKMTRKPTQITIYWDTHWAYRTSDADGDIDSGALDGIADDDLCGAIDLACHELGVDLTHDDFAQEPNVDGGYAVWSA